jgi:dTDP-glucose 4,6-dehydratase
VKELSGKRILVTGAGGFIASHLTETLVQAGALVRAMVRYNSMGSCGWLDHSPVRDEIEIIFGDIRDRDSVREALKGQEIVFHLAAVIAIPYSYRTPDAYVQTNLVGTLNVLQWAKEFGISKLIHTSTSEVYGTARTIPIDELHPLQTQSPYAASKVAADKLAEAFHLSYSLPVATVRPFNTFGPRQSARAVIPTIISQCLLTSRVRLGNLQPTRDFTFVSDTINGFLLAATRPEAIGRVSNLGSGRDISIHELAQLIACLLDRDIQIESEPNRIRPRGSEVERLVANNCVAKVILGWEPTVTLEQGLRLTIDWIRENANRYQAGIYTI